MPTLPGRVEGRFVVLRRPDTGDAPELFAATHGSEAGEAVWAYMGYGPWPDATAMGEWIATTIDSEDPHWWTVATPSGSRVGMASVLNRDAGNRRAEIGHIWYIPAVHRTPVNTEAAYLMMRTCFEDLGCRRVEWKCDARNEPSRRAALRLGFTFEGVFRKHMIVKGRNRDTAWYAMTDDEWPQAAGAMITWLEAASSGDPPPLASLRSPGSSS